MIRRRPRRGVGPEPDHRQTRGHLVGSVTVLAIRSHVHFYAYAATGILSCVVAGYVSSLLLPRTAKNLAGLTLHTRNDP